MCNIGIYLHNNCSVCAMIMSKMVYEIKGIVISFLEEKWKCLNCGSEQVLDRLKQATFERGKKKHITQFSYSGEGNICCAWSQNGFLQSLALSFAHCISVA